ncbi:MAG: tocopherol cyclase family protein [Christensenellales bacterium]|jgi:tocopherol cyclase
MKAYFKGWYFKQSEGHISLALIPSYHIDRYKNKYSSVQIITNQHTLILKYPYEEMCICKDKIVVANNIFSAYGIRFKSKDPAVDIDLNYGEFKTLESNIMGPFKYVPFMQCRHDVISVYHKVSGRAVINSEEIIFSDGSGYIESDSGTSFPKTYLWTQCSYFDKAPCSLMLSVADIPFIIDSFTGCILFIYHQGRHYRLATYNGAKMLEFNEKRVQIAGKNMSFTAELIKKNDKKLLAPVMGELIKPIHESICSTVRYRFIKDNKTVFDFVNDNSSYEYVKTDEKAPLL